MSHTHQQPHRGNGFRRPPGPRIQLTNASEMAHTGKLKWYDQEKRFGFVIPDEGGSDVFLHRSVLRQYGLREETMIKGVPVRFSLEAKPGLRPEVTAISLM